MKKQGKQGNLRITSGKFKGRTIDWKQTLPLRPTLEKVRQAVYNMLGNDLKGIAFLDLFSGTGVHGFEALSRGAEQVVWIEQNPLSCRDILRNAEKLNIPSSSIRVCCGHVQTVLPRLQGRVFDCIYMDPPYHKEKKTAVSEEVYACTSDLIITHQLLDRRGLLITEYAVNHPIDLPLFHLVDERKYGTVGIRLWKIKGES
ncbi:MAG: 16S rRNA (guanine(966)-N(2))-methyltransferase RsmD [Candidatus Aureabacteria bacterium]|nr:16S rRNA (guanine(966)-N(2))-methyltransferase RsmD [Candidatus Auribacterota bacterium]